MPRSEHVTFPDASGRVHCFACEEVSPRLATKARQVEWARDHRRTVAERSLKQTQDAMQKRGRGRPAIGPERKIRVPDDLWAQVEAAAAEKGIPVAEEARLRLARPVRRKR